MWAAVIAASDPTRPVDHVYRAGRRAGGFCRGGAALVASPARSKARLFFRNDEERARAAKTGIQNLRCAIHRRGNSPPRISLFIDERPSRAGSCPPAGSETPGYIPPRPCSCRRRAHAPRPSPPSVWRSRSDRPMTARVPLFGVRAFSDRNGLGAQRGAGGLAAGKKIARVTGCHDCTGRGFWQHAGWMHPVAPGFLANHACVYSFPDPSSFLGMDEAARVVWDAMQGGYPHCRVR